MGESETEVGAGVLVGLVVRIALVLGPVVVPVWVSVGVFVHGLVSAVVGVEVATVFVVVPGAVLVGALAPLDGSRILELEAEFVALVVSVGASAVPDVVPGVGLAAAFAWCWGVAVGLFSPHSPLLV